MSIPQESQALAAIVASSDDAIVSKDLSGIVQSWNASAERIFGYTAQEMIGQPILKILPPDRQEEETAILERLRRGERVDHFRTIRMKKDGTRIEVSVTISPIRDASGKVVGASKIARDITEHEKLVREREELLRAERAARAEAERLNRIKDEFLSTLSHELRTPLNAILGWSQLIHRNKGDAETLEEGLSVIERNARVQTQLIEDLLDMSRIISGKMRLDVQHVDPAAVIQAAIESVQPSADAKNIRLVKVLDPLAGPVAGDPNRLQQVVWNLLNNAIKFTPKGGKVQVLLERVNSHIEITVSDNGQGIKPEFLPHVFDRFRQADASLTREHSGLGLGLAIVKHLVELHGGKVRVKSTGEGQGASFFVEIPILAAKHRVSEREHPTSPAFDTSSSCDRIALDGVKVLVVDDESDARELLRRLLEECHAQVQLADSADAAMQMMKRQIPDVIISDIGMPERDGYALIREIRGLPAEQGGRIPAIALTAFARSEDRMRALRAGYQAHIAKPVEPQELIITVASASGRMGQ